MIKTVLSGLVSCLLLVALSPALAQSARWPTTEFVIVQSDPYSRIPDALQQHRDLTDDEQTAIFDMQVFLTEVAEKYQAMGFRAPELRKVEGASGGEAYMVHLFDYDDAGAPFRVRRVSKDVTEIQIDSSRPFQQDGQPLDRTYEHLAHELFHIVQRAYQPSEGVIQGDWIIEGQAQAMGMHMLKELLNKDPYAGVREDYRLGGRPYSVPLSDSDATRLDDGDYRTASFWRYIAEAYAANRNNGRAGVEETPPDYSYLRTMFEVGYSGQASQNADLAWVDKGLREAMGLGLDRVFANFISTFSDFVPARMTRAPNGSVESAKDGWLNFVLDGCELPHNLTATTVATDVSLVIDKNAAKCFKAQIWGERMADLSIHVRSSDADAIAALRIGLRGGAKVGSPVLIAPVPGGGYIGHWRFNVEAGEPQVLIVSNVAQDPTKSVRSLVNLTISSGYWDSDLTSPRQTAAADAPTPASRPAALARDRTREQAASELASGLRTLNNRSANSTTVSQDYETRGCVNQAFAESGCGPTTSILLSLMPGAFADTFQTSGTGGGLAQVFAQFTAIADTGAFATDRALKDTFEEAAATEGSFVRIMIPAIDYGFTGSFSDAMIEVNGGEGAGLLEARGPQDIQRGPGRLFPYTGTVVIEEFTPAMLRGSFRAQLSDLTRVDFSSFGQDQSLPVHREISGRFAISSPWEGDKRLEVYPVAGNTVESAMEDLYEAFPAMRNFDLGHLKAIAPDAAGGSGGGYTVGRLPVSEVTATPVCDCQCKIDSSQPRACMNICKPKILSCGQANQLALRFETANQEHDALAADVDRMRADFEDYMKTSLRSDQGTIDMYLELFDEKSSPQEKRQLVMSQGMDVSTYGDDETQRRAANPDRPTREEYINRLKEEGIPPERIDFLVKEMDAFWAENGGWPTN